MKWGRSVFLDFCFIILAVGLSASFVWLKHTEASNQISVENTGNLILVSERVENFLDKEHDPASIVSAADFLHRSFANDDAVASQELIDFMLQRAIHELHQAQYSTLYRRKILKRIQQFGIPVDLPVSNFQKVLIHLKDGNYHYLNQRLWLQIKAYGHRLSLMWRFIFSTILFMAGVLVLLKVKRKGLLYSSIPVLALLIVVPWFNSNAAILKNRPVNYEPATYFFELDTASQIGATFIFDNRKFPVGKIIWISESAATFDFSRFCKEGAEELSSGKKHASILLETSASFINQQLQPIGFTCINGEINNPIIHDSWDGLAVVQQNSLLVTRLDQGVYEKIRNNYNVYHEFSLQLRKSNADAFQVPLLVYHDSLLFQANKMIPKYRESRVLMKIKSSSNSSFFLMVDIDTHQLMPQCLVSLCQSVQQQKYFIEFMMMLDVGANNYYKVYNADGTVNHQYRSVIPTDKANNVLTLYLPEKSTYSIEPKY